MNILKRIFTVILIIMLVLSAFAVFALKSGVFTVDARDYVVSLIKKTIGKDVHIGSIELGLINNIVIHDVSIPVEMTFGNKGEFASIKRIIIRFNLIDLINRRDLDKTLSSVIIDSPIINIKKENNVYNVSDFAASFAMPATSTAAPAAPIAIPVNRIKIENGRVIYNDLDRKFASQVNSLFGDIAFKQKTMMLAVSLNGRTVGSDRNNLGLDVDYYLNRKTFRGSVEIRDAALNDWGAYLLSPKDYSINSGNFSVVASVSGEGLKPGAMSIYGYFGLSNGDILIKGGIPVKDIKAMVEVNNDAVKFKNTGFTLYGGKGVLRGTAKKIFTAPEYNADFKLDNVDMAVVSPGNMTGSVKAYIDIKGAGEKISGHAAVMWPAGMLRAMEVKDGAIKGYLNAGVFKLTSVDGSIGGGKLTGAGTVNFKAKDHSCSATLNLDGLKAGELFNSKDFSGNINLSFITGGTLEKPKFTALLKSPAFKYSENNVENFNGILTLAGDALTGSASMAYKKYRDLKVLFKSKLSDELFTIDSFKLDNAADNLVDTKGKVNRKDGAMDIAVLLNNVMLSDLSIDYLDGKDIDGAVKGGLFVRGTAASPVLDLNLAMDGLKIRGAPYKLYAGVHYGGNVIKINEINFNDNLKGTGEFSLKKKIFGVNFDVKGLKGDVISEVMGLKILNSGIIDGKIYVKKEQSGYGGKVDLDVAYSSGIYKGAKIAITGQNNAFNISKFEIKQKSGSLPISGNLTITNDEQIAADFAGVFQNYRLNDKLVLDGAFKLVSSINLTGDSSSSASVAKFEKLSFNGKPQDDLDISLKTEDLSVREFRAKWGLEYYAEATVDNDGDVPQLNALVRVKDADLYPVYTLAGKRDVPLKKESLVKGEFFARGPLNNAAFGGTLSQETGSMSANGSIAIGKENGNYSLTRMSLKYNAVNIDLNNFVSIFSEKYKDTGRVNGSGEIKGSLAKVESSGTLMLAQGRVFELPYDSINTDYTLSGKKLTLVKGELKYKDTFLKLDDSSFEMKGDYDYSASIKTQMKDYIWKGNLLNGNLNFFGSINTEKEVKIDGSVISDNFKFKKHEFKPFVIHLSYRKDSIKIATSKGKTTINADIATSKDRVDIRNATVDEENGNRLLDITGFIDTRKDGNSDFNIAIKDADPQMANDLLGWDHTWSGTGNGNVKISGNPDKGLAYTINVTLVNGAVDNVPFDLFTGLVAIKNDYVDLSPVDPMLLSKEGKYDVKVSGKIPVALSDASVEKIKGQEMSLHAVVKDGDLSILKFLKFIDDASGKLDADLSIKGTKEFPSMTGKVSVTDGEIKLKYLFKDLKNIYANLLVKDNVIDIYNLRGDTERGTLKIANLNEKKGGLMKFMKISEVNWKVTNIGDKIRITDTPYLEFVSGDADVDLEMTGLLDSPNIKGTMNFENARIVYPVNVYDKSGEKTTFKDNYAMRINWDVLVSGGENVRYYKNYLNNFADMTLKFNNGPIKIQDRGNDMKMSGNVNVSKGTYKYMNSELALDTSRQSKVVFDGERRPLLDVWAKTTVRKLDMSGSYGEDLLGANKQSQQKVDLNITAHFYGRVGDVKLDLASEPNYNKNVLLYVLTFGVAPKPSMDLSDAYKYIDVLANSWIKGGTEEIKKWTPLDVIDVKPKNLDRFMPGGSSTPVTAENAPAVEVGLGKTIGEWGYLEWRPKLIDPTNQFKQFAIEQTISIETQINNISKFVAEANFRDKTMYPMNSFEGRIGIEIGTSWDQWNAKPTPVPTAIK